MNAPNPAGAARHADLVIAGIDSLPTLPTVASRLLQLGSQDDADIKEIINLISSDPVLTSRVLSLCRRAELGLGGKVTTVERAVMLLGLQAVRALALSVQILDWTENVAKPNADPFDRVGFWQHSLAVAIAGEMLAKRNPALAVIADEAFVAGLLHDLGKLVLGVLLPQAYKQVVTLADQRAANIAAVERAYLGVDHHTCGKRIAERWGLPAPLHDVIWLHAQPFNALPEAPHRNLIALTRVADALVRQLHIGWSGNFDLSATFEDLARELGVNTEDAKTIIEPLHESLAERSHDLGLSDEPCASTILQSVTAANERLARMNAQLEKRSRTAETQRTTLQAIVAFHERAADSNSGPECLAEVVRSARDLFGLGRYITVFRAGRLHAHPWIVTDHQSDDAASITNAVHPVAEDDDALRQPLDTLEGSLSFLRWLEQQLPGISSLKGIRVTPLVLTENCYAVLVHDRDQVTRAVGDVTMDVLRTTWSAAVTAAAKNDAAHRLGEELAQSNLELMQMQNKLAESRALAKLGELTAGAAHELNNPLTVIRGRSQSLAMRLTAADDKRDAQNIAAASAALSDLIHRLHLIAKPPKPNFQPACIIDVVGDAIKAARERTGDNTDGKPVASIRLNVAESIPTAKVDRELLAEALLEVVVNAIEASASGAIEVRVHTDPLDGRLMIRVTDDGPGFSNHAKTHAFDPFFSEKPAGRQTGLGLATACTLVRLHQGDIRLSERQDGHEGAEVTITLPDWKWRGTHESQAA